MNSEIPSDRSSNKLSGLRRTHPSEKTKTSKTTSSSRPSSRQNDGHKVHLTQHSKSNRSGRSSKTSHHHAGNDQTTFGISSSGSYRNSNSESSTLDVSYHSNTSATSISHYSPPTSIADQRMPQIEYDLLGISLEEVAKTHPYNPQYLYQATDRNLTAKLPHHSAVSQEVLYSRQLVYGLPPMVRYLAEGPAERSTIFK